MHLRARYGHGGRLGYDREWRAQPERSGGGELVDQGMHLLDLTHWIAGPLPLHSALLRTQFWDVAVEDNDARVAILGGVRYFLPHVFALSVNSPFWLGHNTGWKSYRAKVFERFPRTGIPDAFDSWVEYQDYLNTLIATGCIADGKKIWWDARIHPFFPTIEYRICDIQMRVDETICLAAIFQAMTYTLWKLYDRNQTWRQYRRSLIHENKWRAARFGLDEKLIDLGKKIEVPTTALIVELLEFIEDAAVELGVVEEISYVHEIFRRRTGADRQLQVYEQTGSLQDVVRYVIEETEAGIPVA